ncbi:tripartite ATP-independent transporter DctP family solute receptor [Kushneria sinocarnis]|uniref:Tripartite ATP-independent transporter DctP family solute receptor n=1 Tax=Kushneria sinocarnis TaxID=595502 RepID=A0A420X1C6_9GAMM|nr:C4-dicarboxylate TRAP transporter substrate-binding protein [Kushneria sinocarnis]RKR07612.1 tripartite ATP-independent transporter DctP family solute receptor [Kushneria sinocarnis]
MRRKLMSWLATLTVASFALAGNVQAATEIKVAYGNQPGEPIDLAVKQWAKWVKEESQGELVLQPFPASQLGSEMEVTQQARMGSQVIAINSYSNFIDAVPDLSVIDAPYISDTFEDKLKLLESDWFRQQREKMNQAGYHIVVPDVIYGERQLLSREKVSRPEDLKGVKIRVQNSPMYVATVRAMGAVPTPMSLGDVYPALAQGIVDGVENPPSVLYGGKFHEQVKQLNMTGHMQTVTPFVTGEAFWQQLSDEQRRILTETGKRFSDYASKLVQERNDKDIERLKEAGVEVNEVDVAPFRERAREQIPQDFPQWSPGLYDKVLKIING